MEDDDKKQEPLSSMPVIPRLDRLDQLLQVLEEKHSLSTRLFSANTISVETIEKDECKTLSSALEEVQHKGTIMERLTLLENRFLQLQLRLELEEGNTSKSSTSSTIQVSEMTGKDYESSNPTAKLEDENESLATSHQETQHLHPHQPQEEVSSAQGFMTKRTAQQNSTRQKKKTYKKWLGLFQFRLRC